MKLEKTRLFLNSVLIIQGCSGFHVLLFHGGFILCKICTNEDTYSSQMWLKENLNLLHDAILVFGPRHSCGRFKMSTFVGCRWVEVSANEMFSFSCSDIPEWTFHHGGFNALSWLVFSL